MAISENTAKAANGGKAVGKRFADMFKIDPNANKTGSEIAAEVIKKAGLTLSDLEINNECL